MRLEKERLLDDIENVKADMGRIKKKKCKNRINIRG